MDNRARNWTFVAYPESMPSDWQAYLDSCGYVYVVSPLHDRDFNADGTEKKPHYHFLLCFDGKKSAAQVLDIERYLGSNVYPQIVASCKAMIRYFVHLDNPEKAQYNQGDIISHGADIFDFFKPTQSQLMDKFRFIVAIIEHDKIYTYRQLICKLYEIEDDDAVFAATRVFCSSIKEYLRSSPKQES